MHEMSKPIFWEIKRVVKVRQIISGAKTHLKLNEAKNSSFPFLMV